MARSPPTHGILISSGSAMLLNPPWVEATISPWHGLLPPHWAGQVLLGVKTVRASPCESVVGCGGTKEPLKVFEPDTLFCRANTMVSPGIPLSLASFAVATRQTCCVQLAMSVELREHPLLVVSRFNVIWLRFPFTVLRDRGVALAAPERALTCVVVEVMRLTWAFPNLSVLTGLLPMICGLDVSPMKRRPAVLLNLTSWPESGTPSLLATVAVIIAVPQVVTLSRLMQSGVEARTTLVGVACRVIVAPSGAITSDFWQPAMANVSRRAAACAARRPVLVFMKLAPFKRIYPLGVAPTTSSVRYARRQSHDGDRLTSRCSATRRSPSRRCRCARRRCPPRPGDRPRSSRPAPWPRSSPRW